MGVTGPKPRCACGTCQACRGRAAARRAYHRSKGRDVPLLSRHCFTPSELRLPERATDLAYIAGLVDGEGCITLSNQCWRVQVAMTDEAVIRWLGQMGGTVRERRVTGKRQRCWRWLVMRQVEVQELLEALAPYLRVKREAAATASAEIRVRRTERAARERAARSADNSVSIAGPFVTRAEEAAHGVRS